MMQARLHAVAVHAAGCRANKCKFVTAAGAHSATHQAGAMESAAIALHLQ